jgi:hypothetical protein
MLCWNYFNTEETGLVMKIRETLDNSDNFCDMLAYVYNTKLIV